MSQMSAPHMTGYNHPLPAEIEDKELINPINFEEKAHYILKWLC